MLDETETGRVCGLRAWGVPRTGPQRRTGRRPSPGGSGELVCGAPWPLVSGGSGHGRGKGRVRLDKMWSRDTDAGSAGGGAGAPGPPSHTEGRPGAPGAERGSRGRGGSSAWLCGLLGPAFCRTYACDPVRGSLGSAASAGGHPQESVRLPHEERPEPAVGRGSCVGPPVSRSPGTGSHTLSTLQGALP